MNTLGWIAVGFGLYFVVVPPLAALLMKRMERRNRSPFEVPKGERRIGY